MVRDDDLRAGRLILRRIHIDAALQWCRHNRREKEVALQNRYGNFYWPNWLYRTAFNVLTRGGEWCGALFFPWRKLLLLTVPLSLVPFHALPAEGREFTQLRHAFRKFAALRAHFRAALRRWQNCLVSNGAECFQLFLGGESLGCERLLDGGHSCFGRFILLQF